MLIPTKHPRANCFVGKSPSSRYKSASLFRQNTSARTVLSETSRVLDTKLRGPGTNPSASSDKTPPCEQFCRKLSESSIQNCELQARKTLAHSDKTPPRELFCRKFPEFSAPDRQLVPTKPPREQFCRKIPALPVHKSPVSPEISIYNICFNMRKKEVFWYFLKILYRIRIVIY